MILRAGQMQGRLSVAVRKVHLRAGGYQQIHDFCVAFEAGVVQRAPSRIVPVLLVQSTIQ